MILAQACDGNATAVGSIQTQGSELLFINIFITSFWGTSAVLICATQHAMLRKFGGKWGTECINTRFPLPKKLKKKNIKNKLQYIHYCNFFF